MSLLSQAVPIGRSTEEATPMNRQLAFIALAAAIGLGTASPALATDRYFGPPSYRAQTWEDIEQSRLYIQRQIQKEYHLGPAGDPPLPKPVRRPSHKQTQDRY
jgi:hypothetical protein